MIFYQQTTHQQQTQKLTPANNLLHCITIMKKSHQVINSMNRFYFKYTYTWIKYYKHKKSTTFKLH